MKKFLKNVFLFLFPIFILAFIGENALRNIPNDYLYKREYLDKHSNEIEVLILGSSHSYYGINPKFIEMKSFNAGYVSQSLNYDLAILKKYESKWEHLKFIVVPIDYASLYGRLETGIEAWREKNYYIYYGINNNNWTTNNELLSNKFLLNAERFESYYIKKKNMVLCSELGWGKQGTKSKINLLKSGEEAAKRHLAKTTRYFEENLSILRTFIDFAKSKKVKILFLSCPTYKTYYEQLNKEQLETTINEATKLARNNNNVTYLNMLCDSTFNENDFYDADHLNSTGAKKLSMKLDSILKME